MMNIRFLIEQNKSLGDALICRRKALIAKVSQPVLLWSGDRQSRNFRANKLPFRASSHFLYFAGLPLTGSVLFFDGIQSVLFIDFPSKDNVLWHGESVSVNQLGDWLGVNEILPTADLHRYANQAVTIPLVDPQQRSQQSRLLGRTLPAPEQLTGGDRQLAQAIIQLRLCHDDAALRQLQEGINIAIKAHYRGMAVVGHCQTEAQVRAAIESEFCAQQMTCAYTSIVSTQGEILHNEFSPNLLNSGDLLLVDAGAETALGWASDLTRTYPVNGKFSATQRDIYQVVLAAHDQAIAALEPNVEFRDIHHLATKAIATGLRDLGILRGDLDDLLAENICATFFPHGIGHLMGLDVHDMEDLGDLAGYAEQRQRSQKFGECFLRLDRPLQENMVVTIEPGFYQIPALLGDRRQKEPFKSMINWEKLTQFHDVRGIRIEDDIRITQKQAQNLSQTLITQPTDIENFMNS
jgi:Xaa-Pro aminopeptidase